MLAYVFWHWRSPEVEAADYEDRLLEFHRSLSNAPPEGFERSVVFKVRGVPWVETHRAGYEDWYLVDGWSALGALNEGAVSARRQEPHDRVAGASAGGAGAVYALQRGEPSVAGALAAAWLHKPTGVGYAELERRLEPLLARPGYALWRRQLVLGPALELCVVAPERIQVPRELPALTIVPNRIWPPVDEPGREAP